MKAILLLGALQANTLRYHYFKLFIRYIFIKSFYRAALARNQDV